LEFRVEAIDKTNELEPLEKLRAKSNNQQVTLDNTLQVIDYWF